MFAVTEDISLSDYDAFLEETQVGIEYDTEYVVRYDIFWNTSRQTYLQIYLGNYYNNNLGKYCEMSLSKPLF